MNEFVPFLCDQETGIFVCFLELVVQFRTLSFLLLLFLMFPCFFFYDFDFAVFESVVEGLFL
jgi:hypothetical protein